MPQTLQSLLQAIPVAEDDHVITRQYHNSLRAALLALAESGVGGGTPQPTTLTLAPAFLQNDAGPNWAQLNSIATRARGADGQLQAIARGWMQVQLPDGARVKSLTAIGRRFGGISSFLVVLARGGIVEGGVINIALLQLKEAADPFEVSASPGSAPGATDPIDNSKYKYFITATLLGANDPDDVAQINAIKIELQPA